MMSLKYAAKKKNNRRRSKRIINHSPLLVPVSLAQTAATTRSKSNKQNKQLLLAASSSPNDGPEKWQDYISRVKVNTILRRGVERKANVFAVAYLNFHYDKLDQRQNLKPDADEKENMAGPTANAVMDEGTMIELKKTDTWKLRYNELREYKKEFGDCLVPGKYTNNPALGNWVYSQRRRYKLYMNGESRNSSKHKALSSEEIHLLNDAGFVWSIDEYTWKARYEELTEYKKEFGDCLVPETYKENPALGNWVMTQRRRCRTCLNGGSRTSSRHKALWTEKLRLLKDVGFVWNIDEYTWNARYEELRKYKNEFGDCLVPNTYKENQALGTWVTDQRRRYKIMNEESRTVSNLTALSTEELRLLDGVGFTWSWMSA